MKRDYSKSDELLSLIGHGMKTLFGQPKGERKNPGLASVSNDNQMSTAEKKHIAGLMRVNHAGEVCAQALYHGQALTARDPEVKSKMQNCANEEIDHLDWCQTRLEELDSKPSVLGPIWYAGSFAIGAIAGSLGDKWSLGFVAETEHQVVKHLEGHLSQIPETDQRTREILEQMKIDEGHHAYMAESVGATSLPQPVKQAMQTTSNIMKSLAYRL